MGWLSTINNFRFKEMMVAFENAIAFDTDSSIKNSLRKKCAVQLCNVATACFKLSTDYINNIVDNMSYEDKYDKSAAKSKERSIIAEEDDKRCTQIFSLFEVAHSYDTENMTIIKNILHVGNCLKYGKNPIISMYEEKLKILDPSYMAPNPNFKTNPQSGGCFVVTATMGNEQNLSVRLLRSFRDKSLVRYRVGRLFIDYYYIYGPLLAMYIEKSKTARILSYLIIVAPSVAIVRLLNFINNLIEHIRNIHHS